MLTAHAPHSSATTSDRRVVDFSWFRSLKNRKRSTARCRNSGGYIQRMPHADRFGGRARSCSISDAASSATCSASTLSDRFSTLRSRDSPRGCESGAAGPCNALTVPAAGTGFAFGRLCATSWHSNRKMRGGSLSLPPCRQHHACALLKSLAPLASARRPAPQARYTTTLRRRATGSRISHKCHCLALRSCFRERHLDRVLP
jgi:hypothetical protein